ncbi:hypothetical protein BN1723_020135, partial [Verticillium longisporum]
RSGTHP